LGTVIRDGRTDTTTIKAIVRDGRIETEEPLDLPEGTELLIACPGRAPDDDDGPMSSDEIARIHAAMQTLLPLDIPDDVAADLDAWEHKLNQHGIDNAAKGIEDVFR
jgi:hypothetical protein